jgi:hypothetical protein
MKIVINNYGIRASCSEVPQSKNLSALKIWFFQASFHYYMLILNNFKPSSLLLLERQTTVSL